MRDWKQFRLWLLVAAFIGGQLLMLAHGAEHADADEPAHVCQLCLSGHDLGSAIPPACADRAFPPFASAAWLAVADIRAVDDRRTKRLARGPPPA